MPTATLDPELALTLFVAPVLLEAAFVTSPRDLRRRAASAILKQLRLPHRLLVILEGESLFKEASALLIYRVAVASALVEGTPVWHQAPLLLFGSLASVPLGLLFAWLVTRSLAHVQDMSRAVIVQFLSTFAVWMIAERLHLSGIITIDEDGGRGGRC